MKSRAPVIVSIVSTRFWTPASLGVPPAAGLPVQVHQAPDRRAVDVADRWRSMSSLRSPAW